MGIEHTPKPRPYWHVDAKWISGLILAFMLSVTLLIYGLVQVTAEQPATEVLTLATALMFSPNGLDDESDIALLRQVLALSPDGTIQPIPGMGITVSAQEIEGLTPRETRLQFFRKWAEAIYPDGIQGLADLADDPELKAQILEGGAVFNVLTLPTHQALQRALILLAAVSFFMFIPLVLFSYRFGRIGSPGCALFFASLPGAIFFTFLAMAVKPILAPSIEESSATGMLGYLVSQVLPSMAKSIGQSYQVFLALGVGLMLLAGLSSIVWSLVHPNKQ